ncbi:MAG: hypothetical protein V4591_09340 [Bdellovibrionota bacterium]
MCNPSTSLGSVVGFSSKKSKAIKAEIKNIDDALAQINDKITRLSTWGFHKAEKKLGLEKIKELYNQKNLTTNVDQVKYLKGSSGFCMGTSSCLRI